MNLNPMSDELAYKQILTKLIQKQMLLVGKKIAIEKIRKIHGLKVKDDGTVESIEENISQTLDEVLAAFTNLPSLIAAKEIIEAKSEQAKEIREQIASGWLQIEHEKSHLTSAIESLQIGFITTNQNLQIIIANPAVDRILGPSPSGKWSISEIQNSITGEFFLPLLCKKCIELLAPLPPDLVNFKEKKLKIFISPIKAFSRGIEELGVTILIEEIA